MHIRQNIESMSEADIATYQRAIARALAITDNRGYQHFAGLHGWPQNLCKHHVSLFLPWHRAYLYMFELSLRDVAGEIALPWWDWTSEEAHRFGLPDAFTAGQGGLASVPVPLDPPTLQAVQQQVPWALDLTGAVPKTTRNPDPADSLPTIAEVDDVLDAPTYADFTSRLEDIHDGIHGWFKGTMSIVPFAAFDPIFWAHHAMIDRLWYRWQLRHPGIGVPNEIADSALEGFPLTVPQVLDIATLGYDYATGVVA
ncbi:tyrosinase family protein [soil metagenome]